MTLEHMRELFLLQACMEADDNKTRLEYIRRELNVLRHELYPVCPLIIPLEIAA